MSKSIVAKTCIVCARNIVLAIGVVTALYALVAFGMRPFESFILADHTRCGMYTAGTLAVATVWALCVTVKLTEAKEPTAKVFWIMLITFAVLASLVVFAGDTIIGPFNQSNPAATPYMFLSLLIGGGDMLLAIAHLSGELKFPKEQLAKG